MRDDDHIVDAALATRLIAGQVPEVAHLPLIPVAGGTDHSLFRLGPAHAARFPRRAGAAAQVLSEARWLPRLAPHLDLPLPLPVALGQPAGGYPHPWAITRWIAGDTADAAPPDQDRCADALARLIGALWRLSVPEGAPRMAPGRRLADDDAFVRKMIAAFRPDEGYPARLMAAWQTCRALPPWQGAPVWAHADLHPLNLISDGRDLTGVIDWGGLCAGDPALDLICAWTMLDAPARDRLRRELAPDPGAWARGRAFAFSMAVQAIPWYRDRNPRFRRTMVATLARCLADGVAPAA